MSPPDDRRPGGPTPALDAVRLVVTPGSDAAAATDRLDRFLAAATDLSRRAARGVISSGVVSLDGRPCRVQSRPLEVGTVVDVAAEDGDGDALAASLGVPPRPMLPPVTIVHDDPWLIAVDKPSGVLSQPSEAPRPSDPLEALAMDERLLVHRALAEGRRPFLRLVHRIDRPTSGLLLFAHHRRATKPLATAWRRGSVEREYLALVEGSPEFEHEVVDAPLARVPGEWRFEVSGDGKPARTEIEVVERRNDRTLVRCRLDSGRTHQVRVHLAHRGHPVAGDRRYGADPETIPAPRPLLHAARLVLPHPKTGERLEIVAPLPADMAAGAAAGAVRP